MAIVFIRGYEGEGAFGERTESEGRIVAHLFVQLIVHDQGTVAIIADGRDNGISALVNTVVHVAVEL